MGGGGGGGGNVHQARGEDRSRLLLLKWSRSRKTPVGANPGQLGEESVVDRGWHGHRRWRRMKTGQDKDSKNNHRRNRGGHEFHDG